MGRRQARRALPPVVAVRGDRSCAPPRLAAQEKKDTRASHHREQDRGHAEDRRLHPALLGRGQPARCGWRSAAGTRRCSTIRRCPAGHGPERHRPEPGRPGRRARGDVRARGPEGPHAGAQLPLPRGLGPPMERKSVDDGFPTSVLWGFKVEAATGDRVLVDATDFFLQRPARRDPDAAAHQPGNVPAWTRRGARSTCRAPRASRRTPRWR